MAQYFAPSEGLRQKVSVFSIKSNSQPGNSVTVKMLEDPSGKETREILKLWCFDFSYVSRSWQFMILTSLTFAFYLIYGYMQDIAVNISIFQLIVDFLARLRSVVCHCFLSDWLTYPELIFKLEGFQPFGWYLTLVQFAYYTVFGVAELQLKEDKNRKIPMKMYLLLAFLTVATMGLSNTSVGYLNYPTQVIFKCCKLIPVLVGGILIQGKKFSLIDIIACLCMSVGLILFTLADSSVSPNFNTYGVVLISLALCADGAIGNVQEKTLKQYGASNGEMVLYSYGIGFVYILVGLVASGGLLPAFYFCQEHPVETYGYAVIFSITGYLGLYIVLTMVKSFGALIAVTVTTCRKAVTIVLSFVFFSKPFTYQYLWSGLVVVLGIYLNLYSKNKTSWDAKMASLLQKSGLLKRKRATQPENIV